MSASPRKPSRRIGGAPSTSPHRHARLGGRSGAVKDGVVAVGPHGSRASGKVNAVAAADGGAMSARGRRPPFNGAGQRCQSDDVRSGLSTPCTERAEQYIQRIAGQARLAATTAPLEWALVQELDAVDQITRENERRRVEREKRLEHQKVLKSQLDQQLQVKDECRQLWRKWRDELEDDAEQYKKEEDAKRARAIEVRRQFDEDRRRQLEAVHSERRARQETDNKESRAMLAAAQQAKKKADEVEEERRNRERTAALKMAEEARVAQVRKSRLRKEEHENDIKMAKVQQELLEKQDRERTAFFQGLRDKQSAAIAAYAAGVGNELERRQREDEERAQRQQRAVIEKERQQVEAKETRIREMKEAGKVAVAQQLEAQERNRKKAQEEEHLFVQRLRREADVADEIERAKAEKKRQAIEANAAFVRNQIKERSNVETTQIQRDRMNDVERQINKEKLERAKDPARPDGLQLLLKKKKMEYRNAHSAR